MEITTLESLGMNKTEAKVYLALLELGEVQAGQISKKSGVNRTSTYDSLERLISKGLVKYVIQSNKKVFGADKPNKIVEQLKEQERIAKQILPELNNLFKESKKDEESEIYKGRKGIRSILFEIVKYKEYIAFGSKGKFLEIMKHDFEIFQKRKKKLKIKARVILRESDRTSESVKVAYSDFKFVPDEYGSPTTTFVYGNNIAIIVWLSEPIATVIKSKEVAESYSHYFELLWKIAKK